MRVRSARRLAAVLYSRRLIDYDPFSVVYSLSCSYLRYDALTRYYHLIVNCGRKIYRRKHTCPLRLFSCVAELLRENMAHHQKNIVRRRGEPALGSFVLDRVAPERLLVVSTTYPTFPSVLNGTRPPDQIMQDWLVEDCSQVKAEVDEYHNSREVTDAGLRTQALTQLTEPRTDYADKETVEDIVDMLISLWVTMPPDDIQSPRMTVEALVAQPMTKSIAGAVNVQASHGITTGTKEEMATAAAVAAMASHEVLNCVGSPKAEVIKRGKKVRQIIAEPMPIYLKSSFFFGSIVRRHGRIVDGDTTGLSKIEGRFLQWLFACFLDEREFEPELEWEEFLDLLDDIGLDEDDKVAWEKTTNRASAYTACLYLSSLITVHPADRNHLAQVLAHQMAPVVKFLEHLCYIAPFKVASGTFFTLYLNNLRHIAGTRKVGIVLMQHGNAWGKEGCPCRYCAALAKFNCLGEKVTLREISRVTGGAHLGDDRIRLGCHADRVAALVDVALGTETKAANTKAFGEAEFLRTRLRRDGGNISAFRPAARVIAKLYHGDAKNSKPRLLAALQCATLEMGDNAEGNRMLQDLYRRLNPTKAELRLAEDEVKRHLHKGLLPGDPVQPFTLDEVKLRTCAMDKPFLETLVAHAKAMSFYSVPK